MKFFKEMLSVEGKMSSKRTITFLAFILTGVAFLSNLFFDLTVDENMYDGMTYIVFTGLGVVVGEHLLKKKNGESPSSKIDKVEDSNELGDN